MADITQNNWNWKKARMNIDNISKAIVYVAAAALVGFGYAAYKYNKPIGGVTYKLLGQMCDKNEGISHIQRNYLKPSTFDVWCKDSAKFLFVTFYRVEKHEHTAGKITHKESEL